MMTMNMSLAFTITSQVRVNNVPVGYSSSLSSTLSMSSSSSNYSNTSRRTLLNNSVMKLGFVSTIFFGMTTQKTLAEENNTTVDDLAMPTQDEQQAQAVSIMLYYTLYVRSVS